jgi:hypothetical protein
MDLVSRIEESLKDDVISNSILNDCRKIYEYIVLQLGSIKNIKYENFDTTDRVKQVSTQL